jgi:anti-anti-sigma regulatory factor
MGHPETIHFDAPQPVSGPKTRASTKGLKGVNKLEKDIHTWETWTFPEDIKFEDVSSFSEIFEKDMSDKNIIFDLTQTTGMHSSFVGFLIHVKHHLKLNDNKLLLRISFTVERLLILLNIMEYFTPDTETVFHRKSA